jgi:hypothetical protein
MPSYNLTNVSAYETLLSNLSQLILNVEDADSTQIIGHFFVNTYRDKKNQYAKKFTEGVFLVDESAAEKVDDTSLTYETNLDCYLVFQHLDSTDNDFTSDFHKIISLIEKEFKTSSLTSTVDSKPLEQQFEILTTALTGELPESIMSNDNGNPYYVAQFLIRASKLGY